METPYLACEATFLAGVLLPPIRGLVPFLIRPPLGEWMVASEDLTAAPPRRDRVRTEEPGVPGAFLGVLVWLALSLAGVTGLEP